MSTETRQADAPVELTARVVTEGDRFVATIDGLGLEGSGSTPASAENALIQVVRAWLERQDTAGKLADALGIDDLDDDAEIVLQFVVAGSADPGAPVET